jgi:phenylacetate-coenzyme A ligase PaaK-like adenylate-forming protein
VAAPWDFRTPNEQRRIQDSLVNQTLVQMALAHVPFVRTRLVAAGIDARTVRKVQDLSRVPMSLRRDVVDPVLNPEGPRAFMLQGTAEGVKRFSDRSVLWRVAAARLFGGEEVQELAIEAASRSVHVHLAYGPGGPIPVSYTRDDLDLLARAGARMAQLVGIDREDRLLNLVPFGPWLDFWGVFYMAHGVGMTAMHTRPEAGELTRAVLGFEHRLPTAVALPADEAVAFPGAAEEAGLSLSELRVVLAVGRSLTLSEREQLGEALARAGASDCRIAAAYGVAEGRVLWGECAVPAGKTETFGFHTFPDLEVVEVVSPETGERMPLETPGEIVITPLGFRGGGAPRWRSGDLALGGVTTKPCPNCGRTVPRVGPSVRRGAWLRRVHLDGRRSRFDFRDAGALLAGMRDWQVEVSGAGDGPHDLVLYVAPQSEEAAPIISIYESLERWGSRPTQIVLAPPEQIAARRQTAGGTWGRFVER